MLLYSSLFETPVGLIKLKHDGQYVIQGEFSRETSVLNSRDQTPLNSMVTHHKSSSPEGSELFQRIQDELVAYFQEPKHRFKLPLKPYGTAFQQRVWAALMVIPAGCTLTYGELANQLYTSPRAIGQACRCNPLPILVPCHRVVGKDGYGGYMGQSKALSYKIALLKHEGCVIEIEHDYPQC